MAKRKRKTSGRSTASRRKNRTQDRMPAGLITLFAGLVLMALAFVPDDRREMFRRTVEQTLGTDKCRLLSVRNPLAHSGRYC